MKIVHAADLHIDSPLRGLRALPGVPVHLFATATRAAFTRLVDACIELDAALLLLAGDVFDGDLQDYNAGHFFIQQLMRLRAKKTRVALVRGNHDARLTRSLDYPPHVKVFASEHAETETYDFDDVRVAVHGQSYREREVTDNLAEKYPPPLAGHLNIGLLHTNATGSTDHDAYAPCTVTQLVAHGYDYWALGHVHARAELHRDPWVVYPGNLQGRHARETGAKGATVIDVERGRVARVTHRDLDVARWEDITLDVDDADDAQGAFDAAQLRFESLRKAAGDRPILVRVRLRAPERMYERLVRAGDSVRETLQDRAAHVGDVWVEKLVLVRSSMRAHSLETATERAFTSLIEDELAKLASDDATLALYLEQLRPLAQAVADPLTAAASRADAARPDDPTYVRALLDRIAALVREQIAEPDA